MPFYIFKKIKKIRTLFPHRVQKTIPHKVKIYWYYTQGHLVPIT